MKKLFLLLICLSSIYSYGQETIFNTNANGTITPKTKFIDTIENGDYTDLTPYILKETETINLDGISYSIKCYRYNGWEYNPGDYNVIEILKGEKTIFSLSCDIGWEFLYEETWSSMTKAKICYSEKLSNNTWALFFEGSSEASQPTLLTIIVIQDGVAQLVHNHPYFVEKVEKINGITTMTLCENTVEWYDENHPANEAIIRTMTIKDGNIYLK